MAQTSPKYWIGRAEQEIRMVDRTEEKYLKSLKSSYQKASRDIKKEVNSFYLKYANIDGTLSGAKISARLSLTEQKLIQQSAADTAGKIVRGNAAVKKDLLSYSKKLQLTRLEGLESEITERVGQLGNIQNTGMDTTLGTTAQEVYARDLWTIDTGQGFSIGYGKIPDSTINTILKTPWSGENYSELLWGNAKKLENILRSELASGMIAGRSNIELAQIISEKMSSAFGAADRLVRTEMTRVASTADMLSYEAAGIAEYEYVATLDDRTSVVCGDLDNEHFRVEDAQEGTNKPPMHPNCRSTTIPWFGADMKKGLERRARDAEGNSISVHANMNFSDWKKEFLLVA